MIIIHILLIWKILSSNRLTLFVRSSIIRHRIPKFSCFLFVPERNLKLKRKHKRTQEIFSRTLIYKTVIRCYIISQCAQTYCTKSFSHWTFNLIYIMDLLLYTRKGQPFPCSSRSYHIGLLLEINASNILCDIWCTIKIFIQNIF